MTPRTSGGPEPSRGGIGDASTTDAGASLGAWLALFGAALLVLPVLAYAAGMASFEATECSAPGFDGECDLAVLAGLVWAAAAFLLVLLVSAAGFVVRAARRRRGRRSPLAGTRGR